MMIQFDHIEIHVRDTSLYVTFLKKLFGGGRFKRISEKNTYMFLTVDNIRFEIKEYKYKFETQNHIGFCLPCLRMKQALKHLNKFSEIKIYKTVMNPDGPCFFFTDHEGICWHMKDYEILDIFTNI